MRTVMIPGRICLAAMLCLATVTTWAEVPCRVPVRDSTRQISKYPHSWTEIKQRHVVMQERDYSCGAAALATIAKYYWGDQVTEETFLRLVDEVLTQEQILDRIENGLTMADLEKVAIKAGYDSVVGILDFPKLTESKIPLVVGITVNDFRHFVVYRGFDGYYVYLADPIRGNVRLPAEEFVEQWQRGAALVIAKRGEDPKEWAPLMVSTREAALGASNTQVIRTAPNRPALTLPYPFLRP